MEANNWTHTLFIDYPNLYLPELELQGNYTTAEVKGLCKIFEESGFGKNSRVLDLSCGIGRHAIALAKDGFHVVGYDPSAFFLKRAIQDTKSQLGSTAHIKFYCGDMHSVVKVLRSNGESDFDIIISMCNSIGYTGTLDDINLFKQILSITANNGLLVTETENRDWRIKNFYPFVNHDYGKFLLYEKWKFNYETSTAESVSNFYERDRSGNKLDLLLNVSIKLRLYSLHELINMLSTAGWNFVKSYGGFNSTVPANSDAFEIVAVSRKLEKPL
jgi:SAM-dependent methyltransferase